MTQNNFVLPSQNSSLSSLSLRLSPGQVLVTAGDEVNTVFTVRSGRLKCLRQFESKEFLVGILGPRDSVGFSDLFDFSDLAVGPGAKPRYRDTYKAVGEVVLMVQSRATAEGWLATAPVGLREAIFGVGRRFRVERYLKRPLDLMPVRARVAATIWILAAQHSGNDAKNQVPVLDLGLTREEVAHLAGTVYESVIRTLTSLQRDGVIELDGRAIKILKEDQLARIGQICLGSLDREPRRGPTIYEKNGVI